MQAIDQHRDTALDSPYSRDRQQAIEALTEAYPGAEEAGQRRIAATFREIAVESSHRDERSLAREKLLDCFDSDSEPIEELVVETFARIAEDSKFSEERLEALDALADIYPALGEARREQVGQVLAEIAGNATFEDVRRRARTRLSDVSRVERSTPTARGGEDTGSNAIGYLGQSLAEHLQQAATDSKEACLQRAEELSDFMDDQTVNDESFDEVRDDVKELIETLEVIDDDDLAADRIERVNRVAARVERLYTH